MKELANLMPNQSIKQFVQYYQQSMDQLDTDELNNHLSTLEQDIKSLVQAYTLEKISWKKTNKIYHIVLASQNLNYINLKTCKNLSILRSKAHYFIK